MFESDAGSNTQTRPAHHTVPTTKLTDENNHEQLKLPFQCKVVDAYHKQQVQDAASKNSKDHTVSDTMESGAISRDSSAVSLNENQDMVGMSGSKCPIVLDSDDESEGHHTPVMKNVNGKEKKYCICKVCLNKKAIVNEVTMLQHHLEAHHSGKYQQWAQENSLDSKLLGDIKKCKVDAEHMTQTLDHNLKEKKLKEWAVKYTHKEFHRAEIEWLVTTDQPVQALKHPKFKHMIDVALCATEAELNGPKVSGEISLTCDAWQAGNMDGYFAVTGHWIEEMVPMQWELKSALVGFTQLCNVHNGELLGQALFKLVGQIGIAHKIGHMTCDNTLNNSTMLQEFA
ncbi:hypothetical protein C0989_001315 [Termitomyces sp. Mn162]|nr:hypothetical protein C0989_001315 [Termitomyces sp. Mn162]